MLANLGDFNSDEHKNGYSKAFMEFMLLPSEELVSYHTHTHIHTTTLHTYYTTLCYTRTHTRTRTHITHHYTIHYILVIMCIFVA